MALPSKWIWISCLCAMVVLVVVVTPAFDELLGTPAHALRHGMLLGSLVVSLLLQPLLARLHDTRRLLQAADVADLLFLHCTRLG